MSRSAHIWLGLLKWLVIPLGLVVAGFFIIGPQIGNLPIVGSKTANLTPTKGVVEKISESTPAPTPDNSQDSSDSNSSSSTSDQNGDSSANITSQLPPPDVQVTVQQGADFSVRRSSSRYRYGRSRYRRDEYGQNQFGIFDGSRPRRRRRTHRRSAPSENVGGVPGPADGGGSGGGEGDTGPQL